MAAIPGSSWVCAECGKVCKSRGGLAKHHSVHKRHPHTVEFRDNVYRVYHAMLDGMLDILLNSSSLTFSRETV